MIGPLPRISRVVAVVFALALVLSACSKDTSPANAATVNGTPITQTQLRTSIPQYKLVFEIQGQVCGQSGPNPPVASQANAACTREVLTQLIQESVLTTYANAHHLVVAQADIDDAIAQITQNAPRESIEQELSTKGVTYEQFRQIVERLLLQSSVKHALAVETLGDEGLRKLYEQRKDELATFHAKHILVRTPEQARKIMKTLTPENFGEAAAKYSSDPGSKDNGGDLGTVPASSFVPEFSKAALAAEPGEIVGPVKSEFGYHIILLVSKDTPTYEEAKLDLIKDTPETEAAFETWLDEQLKTANVTVNPRYGVWDAAATEVAAVNSTLQSPVPPSPAGSPLPVGGQPPVPPGGGGEPIPAN